MGCPSPDLWVGNSCISRIKFIQVGVGKDPFVSKSANCNFVPTYLTPRAGSLMRTSNSQSKSTLWVRPTWRRAGDLPLRHILMTASLSSMICITTLSQCGGILGGTKSKGWTESGPASVGFLLLHGPWELEPVPGFPGPSLEPLPSCLGTGFGLREVTLAEPEANTFLISDHKATAGSPSILTPASIATTSASVDEWEIAVCFLQNQQMTTKVRGPTKHKRHPLVDLLDLKQPA